MLIFSPVSIVNVQLKIDDGEWHKCDKIEDPLFVAPWDPNTLISGLHVITVIQKPKLI